MSLLKNTGIKYKIDNGFMIIEINGIMISQQMYHTAISGNFYDILKKFKSLTSCKNSSKTLIENSMYNARILQNKKLLYELCLSDSYRINVYKQILGHINDVSDINDLISTYCL